MSGMLPWKITFFASGKVRGKGRPRFARRPGNLVVTYDPEQNRSYEAYLKILAAKEMAGLPPVEHPVSLSVLVCLSPPSSWSKRKLELSEKIAPTLKPDLDNVVKMVMDALTKVAWKDDAQVISISASKVYAESEGLIVTVEGVPLLRHDAKASDLDQLG